MKARLWFLLSIALASVLTTACGSTKPSEPDPVWRAAVIESPSDRVLWKIALLSAEQAGFPLAGGLDPASGVIVSGWRTELAPFSKKGNRKRAEIRMEPKGPRQWHIRARVQTQRNMSLSAPLDATRAEWEWAPEDTLTAEILLRRIVAAFDPVLELGDDPSAPGANH